MSTDLEQALRDAFRDAAESVVPRPEPMRRLLRRRRRRWAGVTSFFAAVAVVLSAALVPALQFGSPDRGTDDEGYKITTGWTRNLLASPVRGSLGGDPALVAAAEREIRLRGGDNPRLDQVKVLFLGDAGERRFLAYARYNATNAALYYNDGDPGATVAQLADGGFGNLRLDPLVRLTSVVGPAVIGLVPVDCWFATSAGGIVEDNNTVTRDWVAEPTRSWLVRRSLQPAERWRVMCGDDAGVLYFEGPAMPVGDASEGADLVAAGGLTHGAVVQRWSGPIEGTDGTWTLTTTLLSGGGLAAVLSNRTRGKCGVATNFSPEVAATDTPDRTGWGLTSMAISADPNVVAIRVPASTGSFVYYSDKVLLVTSAPGAWTVQTNMGPAYPGEYLENGVRVLRSNGGPIMIKNVLGDVVARAYVSDQRDMPEYLGEKIVSDW